MAQVIGLAAAKVNGIFRVDVKKMSYDVQRVVTQNVTQGGVKNSKGVFLVSGTFEEVIPKTQQFDWGALEDFSVQFYDYETRAILIFSAEGCLAERIGGNADLGSASAGKTISFKGTLTSKF